MKTTQTTVEYSSSTTIDSIITSTTFTTTASNCKYVFGSTNGNGYGSYVNRINALEFFFLMMMTIFGMLIFTMKIISTIVILHQKIIQIFQLMWLI